jgi:CRP-like cAMP-binding protein
VLGILWALTTDYFEHHEFELNWLINISSLLTVASFSVRAMLPLRALAVASQAFAIPYFMMQPTPLWTPVGWTALFMAINLYHITRILLERRPVKLSSDEQRLYDLVFRNFGPREFLKLSKVGKWETGRKGDLIFSEGGYITKIIVPINGSVSAQQSGRKVATLAPGELIGAGIALTHQISAFEAHFIEDSQYMSWSKSDIEKFIQKNPDLSRKFNDVVNRYLVAQINKLALHLTGNNQLVDNQPAPT